MNDDLDSESLTPLQAYGALRSFAQARGALPLRLALHAALPQVLHADLLHLLRLNFVDDGRSNPVAEADVLFATFCNDLGHGYFRFDAHARSQLLAELDASCANDQQQRSQQVAEFLLQHFERERYSERSGTDAMYRSWMEVERWNALAYADPNAAAEQLAQALQHAAVPSQAAARLRVGALAQTLAAPLVQHQQLLAYAAGVQALQADNVSAAQALLRRVGDGPLRVGAVLLPAAAEVLKAAQVAMSPAPTPAAPPQPTPAPTLTPAPAAPAAPAAHEATHLLPELHHCEYTAYISYAHADNVAWFDWVLNFRNELERGLAATLRGQRLPRLLLAGNDGPSGLAVMDELKARISRSFVFIAVVHDNYVDSSWCLLELEAFAQLYGEAGLRERLYVVALSQRAMQQLESLPLWRRLTEGAAQVWLPFHGLSEPDRPLDIYMAAGLVSPQFRVPFERLRNDLVHRLRRSLARTPEPPQAAHPTLRPELSAAQRQREPPPAAVRGPCIYIESNQHERRLWEDIGQQLKARWAATMHAQGQQRASLRCRGLPIDELNRFPDLNEANGVLLLWGKKSNAALIAQIDLVEKKLPADREAAPGLVLYLMPPNHAADPVPAWGWPVLRWRTDEPATHPEHVLSPPVLDEETPALDDFLLRVFRHWLQNLAADDAGLKPQLPA